MEPTVRAITCPHCRSLLFALELDTKAGGTAWKLTSDSPAVQNDAAGTYMNCTKCAKRVAIEKAPGGGTWKVATGARS